MKELYKFSQFGENVFDDEKLKDALPNPVYKNWKNTKLNESVLERNTADAIAHAMKEWALKKGVTHYCHWFQPMTGATAQKHDSFVEPDDNNLPILRFSGKSLIKGEPDASSFPSGGLRATFEARGYTYWDLTSPAFIKDNVLCIPSIFVSYNGESLDKKLPLLKSLNVVSEAATKLVNLLGDKDVKNVKVMVGLEQEFFLINRKHYHNRLDLKLCNRTLYGTNPPKGQELDDHYFGSISPRVQAYYNEVNQELWKLGIYVKSEHNEVAPGQFEIAPIFSEANVAIDQNLVMMDILKSVAKKHDLACILHEKPFNGVNGSGKHNNYSLVTDTGLNLFDPGDKPSENIRFLVFVSAFIKACDTYPELLRMSASKAGNDLRLGESEAPPAIISIYLGDYIEQIIMTLGKNVKLKDKDDTVNPLTNISYIPKDNSDRNRTSPMAFTGNKFEFRMVGSSISASVCNTILNTIVAKSINEITAQLEGIKYREDIRNKALEICIDTINKHKRIIFSKDGYSDSWVEEAKELGLPNIRTYVESIGSLVDKKAIDLFVSHDIYTEKEILAREEILYEQYIKTINLEMKVLKKIVNNQLKGYMYKDLENLARLNNTLTTPNKVVTKDLNLLNDIINNLDEVFDRIDSTYIEINKQDSIKQTALDVCFKLVPLLKEARSYIDRYEDIADEKNYDMSTYSRMLYL